MITIHLDATIKSTLKWNIPPIDQKVVWRLDLGLENLPKPIEDVQQCAALKLACDYFIDTVYTMYEKETECAILFQGTLDHFDGRDLLSDYLDILTAHFPKSLVMKLVFEAKKDLNPVWNHHLYHIDAFPRFSVVKRNLPQNQDARAAVLLPPPKESIDQLMPFADLKIVSESELLYSFAGLDEIIYDPQKTSEEAKRILAGFAAAEGILREC